MERTEPMENGMHEGTVYASKIDLWLIVVIVVSTGAPLFLSLTSTPHRIGALISASLMLFCGYSVFTIRYRIENDSLLIQSGFFNFQPIPVSSIRKVEETRSVLSSPAASLDRLEIVYNRFDSVLVSPKDKSGFINDLKSINPDIEIRFKKG